MCTTTNSSHIDLEVQKIKFVYSFCNTISTMINSNIRRVNFTNLNDIESHKIIINNIIFLVVSYFDKIYIKIYPKRLKHLNGRMIKKCLPLCYNI